MVDRIQIVTVFVSFLIVFAGCSNSGNTETATSSPQETETLTVTPRKSSIPTPGPSSRDNPWNKTAIKIVVNGPQEKKKQFEDNKNIYYQIIYEALIYWKNKAPKYADYTVDFYYKPAQESGDVYVNYEWRNVCDLPDKGGCAPIIEKNETAPQAAIVRIQLGYDYNTTLHIAKHEFGHLLGIQHGEPPHEVMNSTVDPTKNTERD